METAGSNVGIETKIMVCQRTNFPLEFALPELADEAWLTAHLLSKSQHRRTEDRAGAFCLDGKSFWL